MSFLGAGSAAANSTVNGGGATANSNDDAFRVTYNDGGFNPNKTAQTGTGDRGTSSTRGGQHGVSDLQDGAGSGGKTAAQLAEDAKNRTIGHYVVGRSLGSGTFGKVRIGTHTITGEKVAIKILEKDRIKDKGDVERVTREINILKKVRHPNVIQLYEIIETSRQLFLIMEYACGGELFDYIVKRKKLKEAEACKFFQQIISGVEYIHRCGICHRDLKPENLLLDESKNIKIVDFGLSNTYREGGLLKTACGSPCYAAPEMIAGKKYYGLASDIWSCGIILYAMTCGFLPFEDPNTNKLYKKILACDFTIPSSLSVDCKDLVKKILNTDPAKRITIGDIRQHDWYTRIRSVEMEGVIIGKDRIPVISEFLDMLKEHFSGENLEQATTFVQNNKHNQVTSTYYLLLKKKERTTGKNYVFEQVTFDKRKNLYSTSNLKGNFTRGLEFGLNSTHKLQGTTYARSEGRQGVSGADVRSHGASSSTTNPAGHTNSRDDKLHKRVADIISLPSKTIAPAHATQMASAAQHKLAMQTFNTDSIRAHVPKQAGGQNGGPSNRIAQSHSPTQHHSKLTNDSAGKNGIGLKSQLASMHQTFHSGQKKHANQSSGGAFARPASLDPQPLQQNQAPSRQLQYTSDIHNGTLNLEDTIASSGYHSVQKPDTSHTVGKPANTGVPTTGILPQPTRQGGQAIMAQTFTGKMFSMRNQSLKANQNTAVNNHMVGEKSGSVQYGHAKNLNSFNLGNYNSNSNAPQAQPNQNRQLQPNNGSAQQSPNMNLLLTQFFPNNNYTARHQNLIGQNKLKKKIKSHDASHSPPRAYQGKANATHQADQQALNLGNMKMRTNNQGNSQLGQQAYLQSLNSTLDPESFNAIQQQQKQQASKNSGGQSQTRRLMETSNMFTAYRNSLKNNLNNNSNGYVETQSYGGAQALNDSHNKGSPQLNGQQHLYQTARQGGFFHEQAPTRVNRKQTDVSGIRAGEMEAFANGFNINSNGAGSHNDTLNSRISQQQPGQNPTLKVQDLLRNANNKSGTGHMSGPQIAPGVAHLEESPHTEFMNIHYQHSQQQQMMAREAGHSTKQGAASHLVNRSSGAHALNTHGSAHGNHAISQSIRQQKDSSQTVHSMVNPALQNNFTAMANIQQNVIAGGGQGGGRGNFNSSMGSTHATMQHHPHGHNNSGLRNHDHRTTFYGGKHQGSGNPQSLSLPRSSIVSHMVAPSGGHQRDTSVHLTKRSGFSYF